jgi:hypothetical protein
MKNDHKNMLLGYLAAKSQNRSRDKGLSHFDELNLFQKIWLMIVAWGIPLITLIVITFSLIADDSFEKMNLLGISFDDGRQKAIVFLIGVFSIYILFKTIRKFPRFIFWLTFSPPLIIFLIWLFDM